MAKLVYASNMSLDGLTEDADGALDWAPPDDDVFVTITGLMASMGTYLYGRRMYETMAVWETMPELAARSDLTAAFATAWIAADKVVHSSTLTETSTARTRVVRDFDADAVRDLKATADRDVLVGGPTLAAQAFAAGLVDEVELFVWPIVLGGTKPALPQDGRLEFELLRERRLGAGVVQLSYAVR